jgi:hypothetical protein
VIEVEQIPGPSAAGRIRQIEEKIIAVVGYHENSVHRAVAWIPICVFVTSVVFW